jgi:N-acetylmuramoyl-L-alanine amidase
MEYTRITVETPVTCDIEIVPVLSGNVGTNLVFKAQPTASGPWVNKNKKNIITRGNVTYHSVGDRTAILLNGVQLTEGSKTLTRYYTSASLNGGKTLQITFPSKYGSLSTGTISVYDGTVNEIILEKDSRTGNNIITIHMAEPMVHTVIYRYDVNNTAITLVKQAKKEDRLVVIDPGHGGKEVGAVYNGVYEKNLNLDIALTVQEILESRGINTYIIREDDSYVGLYERAYIANALNASWFVSIHNNALENNSSVNGSMVFYHSASTQGKALASVILNRLTKDLGMPDRGIRVQNEYIVLQGTAMPSALVEVAFMSGDIDFTLLCTAQFRAKAAEAIANGIMDFIGR